MLAFREEEFRRRVDKATETVRQILHRTRSPVYAADAEHSYSDKFVLCNILVRLALGSVFHSLSVAGISNQDLATLVEWSKEATVGLRLEARESCRFVQDTSRERKTSETRITGTVSNQVFSQSTKIVTKITEYEWAVEGRWRLTAFRGVGSDETDLINLMSQNFSRSVITGSKSNPRFDSHVFPNLEVDISWLLQHLSGPDGSVDFEINREVASCCTPRRNKDVNDALFCTSMLSAWCASVRAFFADQVFAIATLGLEADKRPDVLGISTEGVFVPVVPLFVKTLDAGDVGQLVFTPTDMTALLDEQQRSLTARITAVGSTFPETPDSVITTSAVRLCIIVDHLRDIIVQLHQGVDYVEDMLRKQLFAAIGKEISAQDFASFRRFHDRKFFCDDMQPLPFSYAVRRSPLHSPEGQIAVEEQAGGSGSGMREPVFTHVRQGVAAAPMKFSISAATTVRFMGQRSLHAWLRHDFSGQAAPAVQLCARARQLSSFIVLVGKIASADTFEPTHGMIVQNKDELCIPLRVSSIPTPKEFKDAISSLSPAQQAFCKAWRAMQLESSLFTICIIQVKPLLERVLNLPPESLAKEIKLTQDLTELFTKYHIPADLLTAGRIDANALGSDVELAGRQAADKVAEVKVHVEAMTELIAAEKSRQLAEAAQAAVYASASSGAHSPTSPSYSPCYSPSSSSFDEGQMECEVADAPMHRTLGAPRTELALMRERKAAPLDHDRSMKKPRVGKSKVKLSAPMLASSRNTLQVSRNKALQQSSSAPGSSVQDLDGMVLEAKQPHHSTDAGTFPTDRQGETEEGDASSSGKQGKVDGDERAGSAREMEMEVEDYTKVPAELDRRLEEQDASNAVRPTIITAGETWTKQSMRSLLSTKPDEQELDGDALRCEKNRAFELLDVLTRSGALLVHEASLHVVVAATHAFDKSLVDTVVQDNVSPIEQLERSSLIMASSVLGKRPAQLIRSEHVQRLRLRSATLFGDEDGDEELGDVFESASLTSPREL